MMTVQFPLSAVMTSLDLSFRRCCKVFISDAVTFGDGAWALLRTPEIRVLTVSFSTAESLVILSSTAAMNSAKGIFLGARANSFLLSKQSFQHP